MGLRDRLKALVGGRRRRSGGNKVLRLARLPSRVFVDGSMALTGVTVDGLYGMARVTVHEAELRLAPAADPAATAAGSPVQPTKRRAKFYAVVSLGRQTFASRRVRQAPVGSGPDGVARFRWDASAAVVLQRSGATVAQVAVYRAGRVEGALGDRLQCWCQIDLASYFAEAEAEEAEDFGDAAESPGSPAASASSIGEATPPPPAVLRTAAPSQGEESSGWLQPGGDDDGPEAAEAASEAGEGQPAPRRASTSGSEAVLQDAWVPLVDPGDSARVCGRVRVSVRAASPAGLEQQLWRRLLPLADLNGDGLLTEQEFEGLLAAMGSDLAPGEAAKLFQQADADGSGAVDADELAELLAACHKEGEFHRLMRRCPVDGAQLLPGDDLANIIYVTLALDEGTGDSLKGGYTTPEQVSRSWLLSMTEWATQPLLGSTAALWRGNEYRAGGLRTGAAAAHILVFDRATKRVVEEAVSPGLTLAMRALYQTSEGALLLREGTLRKLKQTTDKYGARADCADSAADIPKFLQAFRGHIDMKEYEEPNPAAYSCFNEFFYRRIRPAARPIAAAGDPGVVVSAADCRLTVFGSVGDATRCWIKGRRFSVAGLLGDAPAAAAAAGGAVGRSAGSSTADLGQETGPAAQRGSSSSIAGSGLAAAAPPAALAAPAGAPGGEHAAEAPDGARDGSEDALDAAATSLSAMSFATAASGQAGAAEDGDDGDGSGQLTAADFEGGSLAIFRLAPQDYHRFHLPVGGTVESIRDIPGELMTVNPIAVNSRFADVFTRNKRSVLALRAPGYGRVAYVAIGATVVGSIRWTVRVGQTLQKGEEAGYFAFGGSTIVVLFQRGAVRWDGDLARHSLSSLETRVLMGERLGERYGGGDAVA